MKTMKCICTTCLHVNPRDCLDNKAEKTGYCECCVDTRFVESDGVLYHDEEFTVEQGWIAIERLPRTIT